MHRQKKMFPKIKGLEQLSFGDMAVFGAMMKNLTEHRDTEAVRMNDLHRNLCISPPALSQSINRLEDKGLVERTFSKENRRATYVAFTEEGKKIYLREREIMETLTQKILERMGVEEVKELIRLTNRFHDVMGELILEQNASPKEP
ncbi:MAG: MarR family transcriptional regulator [Bacillota bacterium]|nr:MarR family transcriptional regulator [Bacillota bacterium]